MKILFPIILLLILPSISRAQPQYVYTRISNREGLVSNHVYSILQDRKGFWWFGTANGLQRYDGRKIIMFKAGPNQDDYLPSQAISQIFEDKSGKFWVRCGTEVGLFDPITFRYRRAEIKIRGDVAPRAEYSLWQSPQGQVIITIRNNGCYTYDSLSHSFDFRKNPFTLPDGWSPITITEDAGSGRFWIVADSGLSLFDPIQKQLFNRLNNPEHIQLFNQARLNEHITSFYVDHSRRAWVVTWPPRQPKANFYCYDLRANMLLPDTLGMSSPTSRYHELQTFFEQKNGTVWGFGRMLLLQHDNARKRFYYIRNEHTDDYGLKYDDILCMYEDREKNIWLGTDQGVYVFNPAAQSFHSIGLLKKEDDQSVDRTATSFLETQSGEIWAATWGKGIVAYDKNLQLLGNRLTEKQGRKDENFSRVWSLAQRSANGTIWAGCQSGRLIVHDPKTGQTRYTTIPLLEEKTIRQVVEDKLGNIWLGSQYGHVMKWDPGAQSFDEGFKLIQNIGTIIYRMMIDNKGYLWIATHLKGVYKIDPTTGKILMHYTKAGDPKMSLFSDFASDLAQLNDTTILAVTGALNVIDTETGNVRKITAGDGLPANNINSIAIDEQQGIWLGMLGHLTRLNLRKNIFTTFSQKDGVLNSNFQSGAALKISDDRMLFGTSRDILFFRPQDVRPAVAPPDVNITDFKLFNTYLPPDSILALDKVRLKPNENSISLEFAALSFLQKDKITYYYRLQGIDDEWQRVENMLSANYKMLPAGNYTFQVFCENGEGVASKNVTTLKIFIEPPFWQTWWFVLLIVGAIAVLIYIAHRIRVNRILDMEKVRTRIARDLHDDMGSTLSTINILSEMAKMKVQQDTNKTSEYLNKISDNSTRMMEAMDDIVWSINPMNDNMGKITARMREFATGVLEAKDIDFSFRVDEPVLDIKLDMEQRRDFFLLFKEAVNNLAKYSQCRHAKIEISINGPFLTMKIEDDGIGFDVNNADTGNGLTNMRKRATNIGGDLRINSVPGKGTTVAFRLQIP